MLIYRPSLNTKGPKRIEGSGLVEAAKWDNRLIPQSAVESSWRSLHSPVGAIVCQGPSELGLHHECFLVM